MFQRQHAWQCSAFYARMGALNHWCLLLGRFTSSNTWWSIIGCGGWAWNGMVRSLQRGTETGEGLSFLNKAPVGGSSPVIVKTIFVRLGCTAILIPVQAQSTSRVSGGTATPCDMYDADPDFKWTYSFRNNNCNAVCTQQCKCKIILNYSVQAPPVHA